MPFRLDAAPRFVNCRQLWVKNVLVLALADDPRRHRALVDDFINSAVSPVQDGCARNALMLHYCHVVPFGLVGEGKSTKAQLQSTTREGSTARVALPVTWTRLSAEGKIGRLTPLRFKLASETIMLI